MADAWLQPDVAQIGMTFGAGLLMMLGHHFTLLAYRSASAQAVAPFYYSFMIFAVVVGFLLFGDRPNLLGILGMLTIMVSGLVLLAFERQPLPTAELP
jgi:drug/metabolite transporter (DMT)-like permease